MKKLLLIMLMIVLPLQAFAAMEHNLAHLLGGKSSQNLELVAKHIGDHAAQVPHHHEDDDDDDAGDVHVDNSSKSIQHLSDHEHNISLNVLFMSPAGAGLTDVIAMVPILAVDSFVSRVTIPPLRPPRACA